MKLLVDMGNSRLKSAQYTNGQLQQFFSVAYAKQSPLECLTAHLNTYPDIREVTLVSVLGDRFYQQLKCWCQANDIILNWAASSKQACGIQSRYYEPESLGSDRFVALVGARKLFPNQCCIVVDCGTAVTVDALTAEGVFCGGVIIPGLRLWGDSLVSRADQLNAHQIQHPAVFARDTAQAIGSGSLYGLVGAIEGLCQRMQQQLSQELGAELEVTRILCGGDAALVAEHAQLSFELLPELVLMGLVEFTETSCAS